MDDNSDTEYSDSGSEHDGGGPNREPELHLASVGPTISELGPDLSNAIGVLGFHDPNACYAEQKVSFVFSC